MAIFKRKIKVYIADYEHLGYLRFAVLSLLACPIFIRLKDLWLANNSMGSHLRETILSLPGSEWEKEDYLNLIEQLDEEGFDDFTRVRELLGLATGSDNGWYTLRIGELKAILALAGGDLEQALVWTEWTMGLTHQYSGRNAPIIIAACKRCYYWRRKRSPAAAISECVCSHVRRRCRGSRQCGNERRSGICCNSR